MQNLSQNLPAWYPAWMDQNPVDRAGNPLYNLQPAPFANGLQIIQLSKSLYFSNINNLFGNLDNEQLF